MFSYIALVACVCVLLSIDRKRLELRILPANTRDDQVVCDGRNQLFPAQVKESDKNGYWKIDYTVAKSAVLDHVHVDWK